MSQRTMILSALVAAFVLVVIGGVVARLSEPDTRLAQSDPLPKEAAGAGTRAPDDGVTAALEARERQYRALVDEANRRISEQQRALEEARRRVQAAEARATEVTRVARALPSRRLAREHEDDDDDRWEHEHEREDD